MDIGSIGGGAGAGVLATILAAFGFHRRLNKIEDCKLDKDVFEAYQKSNDEKFDILIKGQERIQIRLDTLNDHIMNRR